MRISLSMMYGALIVAGLSAPTAALADGDAVAIRHRQLINFVTATNVMKLQDSL